jgi:formate-dependent phosphoribosylglycinamide formyltransferase (GAR transformylase)
MPHVVFIAPRFLENTNRYVAAFAALDGEGVRTSVVSGDPESAIPTALRPHLAGHYRVDDPMDAAQLTVAVRAISRGVGPVDRLTGGLEQLQMPMAEVRAALGIEGMLPEIARRFRDKDRMKEVLRARGVPVARSILVGSKDGLRVALTELGYPAIVKPQAGLGARSTFRVTSDNDVEALFAQGIVPSTQSPLQVEEFIRAREYTCETVTVRGVPVWRSGTRYLPSPLETLENPWMQYCVLLPREEENTEWTRFHETNGAALAALFGDAAGTAAGTALTHMEWFLREDGSHLVNEVGARPPGVGIMPLMGIAYDTSFFSVWARLIAKDQFTPRPRVRAAGAAFFRGQGSGTRVARVKGIERAVVDAGDALVELRSPKVGQPRGDGYEGEGYAFVRGDTTDAVKEALLALVQNVQITYS